MRYTYECELRCVGENYYAPYLLYTKSMCATYCQSDRVNKAIIENNNNNTLQHDKLLQYIGQQFFVCFLLKFEAVIDVIELSASKF